MISDFSVSRKKGLYHNNSHSLRIPADGPYVMMLIDKAVVQMTTPVAHHIAWSIINQTDDMLNDEIIVLKVNNQEVNLLPGQARHVAVGLFRKLDDADDFQRGIR